jgi:hypothetical protein
MLYFLDNEIKMLFINDEIRDFKIGNPLNYLKKSPIKVNL